MIYEKDSELNEACKELKQECSVIESYLENKPIIQRTYSYLRNYILSELEYDGYAEEIMI